ncbi:MAG: hypothetical protein DRP51_11060 [Candidatus Zixiibacteriota bacterium]|nr:MAG: hypothetical protein DRP51_11060 [candidate division Zixibacteria bacterium]
MSKYFTYILIVCLIVAGCSQMKGTRRLMSDNEKTFRANCRSCHVLPKPTEKESDEWPIFLKAHSEDKDIPPEDLEKIVEFLQSME